jgi:hypothetical protein
MDQEVITTDEYQHEVYEAVSRLGAIEALELQFRVVVSMLRAMYAAHPERASVRRNFELHIDLLLTNNEARLDPDCGTVLRDIAATLLLPPPNKGR